MQEFTGTLKPDYPSKWPPKLTFHTATCLLNPDVINKCLVPGRPPLTQKVLVAWGKDGDHSISNDIWLLEIDESHRDLVKWKKVTLTDICSNQWQVNNITCSVPTSSQHATHSMAHCTAILH